MKPILAILALVLTSTLFAQQKPERAPRDPRVPGAERQDPPARDQQVRERLRAMRDARSRQDGDERQEQGPRSRPGAGRGEGGRGPGRHGRPGHGPRHHGNGPGRPEGGRRDADDAQRDSARGPRGGLPVNRMALMKERFQQVRAEWLQRAQQRLRARGGREV